MDEKWIRLSGWAIGTAALAVVFGAGFLTGRVFPAHHYEKLVGSTLFDTSTGHMCSYRGDQPAPAPVDVDALLAKPAQVINAANPLGLPSASAQSANLPPGFVPVDPNAPKNADGYPIVKPADPNAGLGSAWTAPPPANPIPACNAL